MRLTLQLDSEWHATSASASGTHTQAHDEDPLPMRTCTSPASSKSAAESALYSKTLRPAGVSAKSKRPEMRSFLLQQGRGPGDSVLVLLVPVVVPLAVPVGRAREGDSDSDAHSCLPVYSESTEPLAVTDNVSRARGP